VGCGSRSMMGRRRLPCLRLFILIFLGTTWMQPAGFTARRWEGRSSEQWIDYDLFGHQIVAHLKPATAKHGTHHNLGDGHDVPVPHFGIVLTMERWTELAERLREAGTNFVIEPTSAFTMRWASGRRCSS
jgi:extradiol dioxygenase family protein